MQEMLAEKEKFTPRAGYNLVGVDQYALPGEMLYLVGHYLKASEANAAKRRAAKQNPGVTFYVYSAKVLRGG